MGPEVPAATEVAATVREKLALARKCMEQAKAYQKACRQMQMACGVHCGVLGLAVYHTSACACWV